MFTQKDQNCQDEFATVVKQLKPSGSARNSAANLHGLDVVWTRKSRDAMPMPAYGYGYEQTLTKRKRSDFRSIS